MSTPLLATKLHMPLIRPELVPRPRLIERLNAGLQRKLTLIAAPAGFGKTTLLTEWAAALGCPVAWISLDDGDNDPARFLAYVIAALQSVKPSIKAALPSPQPLPDEGTLTTLINEISAMPRAASVDSGLSFVLILDDYHLIKAPPIHAAVSFLLDHLPGNMHLVISSRGDPPLPIARLRGRAQMSELRQTDLRFIPKEVSEFLNRTMGLQLSTDDVAALGGHTEGWITGLQMAAVSMQGRDDTASFIRAFTGSNRYIGDYLLEEVLQRQPDAVQTFLLRTSILERLSGALCEAVTGEGDGQATLERLERKNLFIVPLDDQRRWYRYHRLFADLLQQRLQQTQPDLVPALHRQASAWYEYNGWMPEAIDHALSAEDFERAADLIERTAQETMMRSEVATFLRWVEALPDELVRERPSLGIFHAWALLLQGRWQEAKQGRLQDLGMAADLTVERVAPLRAFVAVFQGRVPHAAELSRQALERLPDGDLFLRSIATWSLGLSKLADGDVSAGKQALEEVARMGQEMGNVVVAVMALCSLASLRKRQGQLQEAKEFYERALEFAMDDRGHRLPAASEPLMGLGEIWREWNGLEVATRYLTEGIEWTKEWAETSALDGYMTLARLRQAQGDRDGARRAIEEAQQLAVQFDATELDDLLVSLLQARLWVAQGDTEAAQRWVQEQGLDKDSSGAQFRGGFFAVVRLRKYTDLVLARLWIAQQRPAEALALLEPLLPSMEQQARIDLLVEILILKALAHQALGDGEQAQDALARALSLAEAGGYVRIFLDEGPPMASLLYEAAARGTAPQYVGKLLAAFPVEEPEAARQAAGEMVEPLTARELEVLQLVAEGLSNQEIAAQLFLSLTTVKWHTHNIYGKLAVKNRTQAVAKARALGLLPAA
jgi:LuxR family maltose regulon positive regulatory protein